MDSQRISFSKGLIRKAFLRQLDIRAREFHEAELGPLLQCLSMRHPEEILAFLPHILIAFLDDIEKNEYPADSEYLFYILDEKSHDPFSATVHRSILTTLSREQIHALKNWLELVQDFGKEVYAKDELVSALNLYRAS